MTPLVMPAHSTVEEQIAAGEKLLLSGGHLTRGEEIVILGGRAPSRGTENLLKIQRAGGDPTGLDELE